MLKENEYKYEIVNINGKEIKIPFKELVPLCRTLDINIDEAIEIWLSDHDYIINEEQEELDKKAKGVVKIINRADKPKAKTQKERVQKENPTKELIIKTLAETLETLGVSELNIENKAKLITFSLNGEQYKLDLIQKRKPKQK